MFQDFKNLASEMYIVSPLFNCSVDYAPGKNQTELIDLRYDPLLVHHLGSDSLLFGSTDVSEPTFSVMKVNKSKRRSSVTNDHLSAVHCIATSDIQPDFNGFFKPGTDWIIFTEEVKWDGNHNVVEMNKLKINCTGSLIVSDLYTTISHSLI